MSESLYRYVAECEEISEELRGLLNADDIQTLRIACGQMGFAETHKRLVQTAPAIALFVAATPAERLKKRAWQNKEDRCWLAYGGIVWLAGARRLLETADRHPLKPGGSYRSKAGMALQAFVELHSPLPSFWPFEDGPSPFCKSS